MKRNKFDLLIIMLFYLSIVLFFCISSIKQSETGDASAAPLPLLLFPFFIAFLQLVRILMLKGSVKVGYVGKFWFYIFLYYLFAYVLGLTLGRSGYKYNVYWFTICPPVAWIYFSMVIQKYSKVREFLVKSSFWYLLILSAISLYFIPRSIHDNGMFASLNTGYFILLAYPMCMLDNSRKKKIIASVLMILIVLLSMKRGGILAMALGFILYYFLLNNNNTPWWRKFSSLLILAALLFYLVPKVNDISGGTLESRYENTKENGDDEARSIMYPMILYSVWQSPAYNIILGHGHNAVKEDDIAFGLAAHNDYLEFLYDYGIVGLLLLLLFQIRLIKTTARSRKIDEGFFASIFALSSILVLSMVSIMYAFIYFLSIIPFWCLMSQKLNMNNKESNIR